MSAVLAFMILFSAAQDLSAQQDQNAQNAQAKRPPQKKAQAPSPSCDQKIGFLFDVRSLLSGVDAYSDGYQAGLGLIWKIGPHFSLRALGALDIVNTAEVTTSAFGLGASPIWVLTEGKVSPYLGALGGIRITGAPTGGANHLYGGILGGVEMVIWENVSLVAEYKLVLGSDTSRIVFKLAPNSETTTVTTTTTEVTGQTTTTTSTVTDSAASGTLLGIVIYFQGTLSKVVEKYEATHYLD